MTCLRRAIGLRGSHSLSTEVVWRAALESGANVLALNIIETAQSSKTGIERLSSLNAKILEHQEDGLYVAWPL